MGIPAGYSFHGRQSGTTTGTTALAISPAPPDPDNTDRADNGKASVIIYKFVVTGGAIFLQDGNEAYNTAHIETEIDASSEPQYHGPVMIAGCPKYLVANGAQTFTLEMYVK